MAENPRKTRTAKLNELDSESIKLAKEKIDMIREELKSAEMVHNSKLRSAKQDELMLEYAQLLKHQKEEILRLQNEGLTVDEDITDELKVQLTANKAMTQEHIRHKKNLMTISGTYQKMEKLGGSIFGYLMQSDKIIKSTILNLGMSGAKAEIMRSAFEGTSGYAARLGADIGDIQSVMQGFADETGRARVLSDAMVKSVLQIGKGTGLGVEQATKLAAQFEIMGINAISAMDYAQGVVETSELMGVNSSRVLKNISDNFDKLQNYTFSKGVKGFANMAMYAEKFHIDMSQALDSAQTARSLEGAVDLAAQLQVMGGQFAATDPFKMLYEARNAPDEFQKSINEMTKGLATFRKNSEGIYENFVSPADIDRISQIEKSLGLQSGELVKQARRMNEIQQMRQNMVGMGLSSTEKTLIEGMATFNSETGRFSVQVAGAVKDIRNLNKEELKILTRQSESLENRALNAQTFDEAFSNTIAEFKTVLLPMLRGVNSVLEFVRPIAIGINDWVSKLAETQPGLLKFGGMLLAGGALLTRALKPIAGGMLRSIGSRIGGGTTSSGSKMMGKGKMAAGMGKGALGIGAGLGAAALGIGAGIGAAASGISLLADSMSKLDETQAEVLKDIVASLGWFVGGAALAAGGIMVFGGASAAAAPGLLAFSVAALGVGAAVGIAAAGIGLATEGIGSMAGSFALLNMSGGDSIGVQLFGIAAGIGAITASMGLLGMASLPLLSYNLGSIAEKGDDLYKIGTAFENINKVLSTGDGNLERVKSAILSISKADLSNLNQFSQLREILSKPIQVEFKDKEVAMVNNITLDIDGYKMHQRIGTTGFVANNTKEGSTGKGTINWG